MKQMIAGAAAFIFSFTLMQGVTLPVPPQQLTMTAAPISSGSSPAEAMPPHPDEPYLCCRRFCYSYCCSGPKPQEDWTLDDWAQHFGGSISEGSDIELVKQRKREFLAWHEGNQRLYKRVINLKDPLSQAIVMQRPDIALWLLGEGADPRINFPLHSLLIRNDYFTITSRRDQYIAQLKEVITLLIERGANIHAFKPAPPGQRADPYNNTPPIYCALTSTSRHTSLMTHLLEHGALGVGADFGLIFYLLDAFTFGRPDGEKTPREELKTAINASTRSAELRASILFFAEKWVRERIAELAAEAIIHTPSTPDLPRQLSEQLEAFELLLVGPLPPSAPAVPDPKGITRAVDAPLLVHPRLAVGVGAGAGVVRRVMPSPPSAEGDPAPLGTEL